MVSDGLLLPRMMTRAATATNPRLRPSSARNRSRSNDSPDGRGGGALPGSYSTAGDVALFAQALLDRLAGKAQVILPWLKPATLKLMTQPEQPPAAVSGATIFRPQTASRLRRCCGGFGSGTLTLRSRGRGVRSFRLEASVTQGSPVPLCGWIPAVIPLSFFWRTPSIREVRPLFRRCEGRWLRQWRLHFGSSISVSFRHDFQHAYWYRCPRIDAFCRVARSCEASQRPFTVRVADEPDRPRSRWATDN